MSKGGGGGEREIEVTRFDSLSTKTVRRVNMTCTTILAVNETGQQSASTVHRACLRCKYTFSFTKSFVRSLHKQVRYVLE